MAEMTEIQNRQSKYEVIFILKANLGEEETAAQVAKYKDLITSAGTVDSLDEWGKRRLAYPIRNEADGYYVQIEFTARKNFPDELDRQLKLNDAILRSLIVQLPVLKKRKEKAVNAEKEKAETTNVVTAPAAAEPTTKPAAEEPAAEAK